jgi:serine/threonine protein kinase
VTHLVEIASGNFGKVFKAIFEGRLVVVKQPRATEVEAQLQEFNTLMRIPRHRHVLALIGGIIADNKQVWLVLPFVSGGSLEARMQREPTWGAVDPARTHTAVVGMFDGLSHLHEQHILHNDCTWHRGPVLFSSHARSVSWVVWCCCAVAQCRVVMWSLTQSISPLSIRCC